MEFIESDFGPFLKKVELVGRWKDDEAVYLVRREDNVSDEYAVKKICKILNHKSMEHMYFAYRNAGKLTVGARKMTDNVVHKCKIC